MRPPHDLSPRFALLALLALLLPLGWGCGDVSDEPVRCGDEEPPCPAGSVCDGFSRICVPPCPADAQCGVTEETVCVDGECEFRCFFDGDANCPDGQPVCDEGVCAECVEDPDCRNEDHPVDYCDDRVCHTGCTSDEACPEGVPCEDGRCEPCTQGDDCGPDEACVFGRCVPNFDCRVATDCEPGHICLDGLCTPFPCSETFAPECNGFCEVGTCAPVDGGDFCACQDLGASGLGAAAAPAALGPFEYGVDKDPAFSPEATMPGESAEQALSFDVTVGELETFRAEIHYPEGFGFAGFLALGPPGTQVGAYGFDFDHDGTVDSEVPILSLRDDRAFADANRDGIFSHGGDALIEHYLGSHHLAATLPAGGDLDASTLFARSDARRHVALFAGLISSPDTAGTYTVEGCFTSVDPDTDGADDGQGDPPQGFCDSFDVEVVPPADGKVELCHKPGTPAQKKLALPLAAVPGHLGHGDLLGPCP